MYSAKVITQDQALCHLYFHCCLKDDIAAPEEIDALSSRFVSLGLQAHLNFKDEIIIYRNYKQDIKDEQAFLEYLLHLIHPVNELALYSYCLELALSDGSLDNAEEQVINNLAGLLVIDSNHQEVIKNLMLQRKLAESQKIL